MAFTPYSTPVEPVEWKPPVSEDLLLKGALFTDKNIQDNIQKADDLLLDKLYSIPSLPGEDTKKKQEIIDGVLQQVSKISHNDFRNPSTLNQLKGYISQVTSNPDFMGIAERGTVTEIEAKKQADALAKGETYYSRILKQAERYINQGLYIRDTKFTGQGFLDPKIGKRLTEEIGKLKKIKSFDPKTGRVDEFYDPNEISLITNNMMSDPNVRALKDYEFEEQFADRDWGTEGLQDATEKLNALSAYKNEALQILNKDPNNVMAKQALYEVEGYISKYSSAINNPGVNGEILKSLRKEEFMNDFKEDLMNIQNSHSFGGFDMSKQEEMYRQLQNQKAIIAAQGAKEKEVYAYKAKVDSEFVSTIKDPIARSIYERASKLGIPILDAYGTRRNLVDVENDLKGKIGTSQKDESEKKTVVNLETQKGDEKVKIKTDLYSVKDAITGGDESSVIDLLNSYHDIMGNEHDVVKAKYNPLKRSYTVEIEIPNRFNKTVEYPVDDIVKGVEKAFPTSHGNSTSEKKDLGV
jgi:flagellar biosynthesis chaperone FliJ